jgi:hypothetical protein
MSKTEAWRRTGNLTGGKAIAGPDGNYKLKARLIAGPYAPCIHDSEVRQGRYALYEGEFGTRLTPAYGFEVRGVPDVQEFRFDAIVERVEHSFISGKAVLEGGDAPLGPSVNGVAWRAGQGSHGSMADDGSFTVRVNSNEPGAYLVFVSPHPDYISQVVRLENINPGRVRDQEIDLGELNFRKKTVTVLGRVETLVPPTQVKVHEHLGGTDDIRGQFDRDWVVPVGTDGSFEFLADPAATYRFEGIREDGSRVQVDRVLVNGDKGISRVQAAFADGRPALTLIFR